jgi:hypothetical protein
MKTRTLARRMVRVAVTPTKIEADRIARAQAEAEREEVNLDLHSYLDRAYQKFISAYPPGYEPLAKAIEMWAKAPSAETFESSKPPAKFVGDLDQPPITSVDSYSRIYSQPANRKPR